MDKGSVFLGFWLGAIFIRILARMNTTQ